MVGSQPSTVQSRAATEKIITGNDIRISERSMMEFPDCDNYTVDVEIHRHRSATDGAR